MHRPYTVKVELVRGCQLRCPFCALRTMPWKGSVETMSEGTFRKAVTDASVMTKFRLELAERGEPTLHPQLVGFIKLARTLAPKCQILLTSNTMNFSKFGNGAEYRVYIQSLLDAGLNIAMLDAYTPDRYEELCTLFPEANKFYEDSVNPYGYVSPKLKQIMLVGLRHGQRDRIRDFHNMGGSVDVVAATKAGYHVRSVDKPLDAMCVRPFREIVVHYDGTVPLCCNDWKDEGSIGNVNTTNLMELWNNMNPARRLLLARLRSNLSPCARCSERPGFRVGLEKNWFDYELL